MRILFAIAVALLTGAALPAMADSLPIENGRYSGGAVLVLNLSAAQVRTIEEHYKPYMELPLDPDQQVTIGQASKLRPAPTKLIVVFPSDTVGDCTCGLANIGLIFQRGVIEIPLEYLGTDEEAEARKITD